MGKGICKYAIPMKPPYQFQFACAVMYECRWKSGGKNMYKSCPRFQIGENMERDGQELRGRRAVQRYDDIRKALEDQAVKEIIIQKHSGLGKSEEPLDITGAVCEAENERQGRMKYE